MAPLGTGLFGFFDLTDIEQCRTFSGCLQDWLSGIRDPERYPYSELSQNQRDTIQRTAQHLDNSPLMSAIIRPFLAIPLYGPGSGPRILERARDMMVYAIAPAEIPGTSAYRMAENAWNTRTPLASDNFQSEVAQTQTVKGDSAVGFLATAQTSEECASRNPFAIRSDNSDNNIPAIIRLRGFVNAGREGVAQRRALEQTQERDELPPVETTILNSLSTQAATTPLIPSQSAVGQRPPRRRLPESRPGGINNGVTSSSTRRIVRGGRGGIPGAGRQGPRDEYDENGMNEEDRIEEKNRIVAQSLQAEEGAEASRLGVMNQSRGSRNAQVSSRQAKKPKIHAECGQAERQGKTVPNTPIMPKGHRPIVDGSISWFPARVGIEDSSKLRIEFDTEKKDKNTGEWVPGTHCVYDYRQPMDFYSTEKVKKLNQWRAQIRSRRFPPATKTRAYWSESEKIAIMKLVKQQMNQNRGSTVLWNRLANTFNKMNEGQKRMPGDKLIKEGRKKVPSVEKEENPPWRTASAIKGQAYKWPEFTYSRLEASRKASEALRYRIENPINDSASSESSFNISTDSVEFPDPSPLPSLETWTEKKKQERKAERDTGASATGSCIKTPSNTIEPTETPSEISRSTPAKITFNSPVSTSKKRAYDDEEDIIDDEEDITDDEEDISDDGEESCRNSDSDLDMSGVSP